MNEMDQSATGETASTNGAAASNEAETFVIVEEPAGPDESERGFFYNTVYSACYYLSFGLVFPTVLAARSIPAPASLRDGLADGASAANGSVERVRQGTSRVVASAAQSCGETVEGIQDRIAEAKYRRQHDRLATTGST